MLKQLSEGHVDHRSELGIESAHFASNSFVSFLCASDGLAFIFSVTQCLVDLAGASAKATEAVLRVCLSAATLPAVGPDDVLPVAIPVAYDILGMGLLIYYFVLLLLLANLISETIAALMSRTPLGREEQVADAVHKVINGVFAATGSLEVALKAASQSLLPAYVASQNAHIAESRRSFFEVSLRSSVVQVTDCMPCCFLFSDSGRRC